MEKINSNSTHDQLTSLTEKHNRYRQSGLALMATIITLSTGAIALSLKLTSPIQQNQAIAFSVVIAIALLQQLLNYLGEAFEARGTKAWLLSQGLAVQRPLDDDMLNDSVRAHNHADWMFLLADFFCVIAVIAFLGCGSWVLYKLPQDINGNQTATLYPESATISSRSLMKYHQTMQGHIK